MDTKGKSGETHLRNEISRLTKAEQELRASNQRLQLIMEATNDGFWDWDVKTGEIYYNPAFYTMLGYQEETFPKEISFIEQLLHPDERDWVLNTVNQCVEGSINHFEQEFRMKTIHDEWIWVLARGKCVQRDQNGKGERIVGTYTDITGRKQAEEKIRQSQQLLQSISDNMFDLIALTDMQGNYTFAGASHKILGYETDKFIGTNVMDYVHPDDLAMVKSAFDESVKTLDDRKMVRYRNICADGSSLWFETVGRFIYDEKGNPQQILFNARDITERINADEALRESEERFRLLVDLAPVGIIITDEKQNPAYVSPTFTNIFGYTIQDIPTIDHWLLLAYPDENLRNKVKQAWFDFSERVKEQTGDVTPLEYPVHCRDGSIKHIEFRLAISGGIHVIIFTDVTERKNAQEEIARERLQLMSIFNSIDEVIYISDTETHEILYVNKKSVESLKKDCTGKKCYKEFHNLDSPCSFCTNRIIKNNNEQPYYWEFHNHLLSKDFAITDRLIDWPDGRKVRFEIAIDVTQQKIAERALRASEEKFRSLVDQASEMLFLHDMQGSILEVNNASIKNTGYSKDELLNLNVLDIDTEVHNRHDIRNYWVAMKPGDAPVLFEGKHRRKDGTVYDSEITISKIAFSGNSYILALARDITERKKAEEKVLMLSKGIEQSPAVVVITDLVGTIEYVNPRFTDVTGYTFEEAIGQNPRVLKSGKQSSAYYKGLWETISSGKEWHGEFHNKKKTGSFSGRLPPSHLL